MAGSEIPARGLGTGSTVHHWMLELGKAARGFLGFKLTMRYIHGIQRLV